MERVLMRCDVLVAGGGPGGWAAAVEAARHGADVILVDRNGYLGGNMATGLPLLAYLDKNGRQVTKGIAEEFISRLDSVGGTFGHARCPMHNSVTVVNPEIVKLITYEMANEAGVRILLHCELCGVDSEDGHINSVTFAGKGMLFEISASVYIDGTGDGDVAYAAGASCEKGMEGTGVMQPPTVLFTIGGVNKERFYDYLDAHPEMLTQPESMQVGAGYNTALFRKFKSHVILGMKPFLDELRNRGECPVDRDTLIFINSMNEDQLVVNSTRILSFDGSDPRELTRGEFKGLEQVSPLIKVLNKYIPGFEKAYISSISPNIGVRETRRVIGFKTLKIDSVLAGAVPDDTIALGSYKVDIHSGTGAGTRLEVLDMPYGIPYSCLVSSEFDNLMMSGRCISMDSASLGTVRVMPTCMAIGHAAGIAAALAAKESIKAADINVCTIRSILIDENAVLS